MEWKNLANTKSISFKDEYEKEYEFLLSQSNPSQFVCELIRKAMNEDDLESKVKDIVIKCLAGAITTNVSLTPVDNTQDKIDEIEDPW